ncbi:UNVERIFIED_CONTAM: hypothetical protein NCL1_32473 [Trichonephila clavipes]
MSLLEFAMLFEPYYIKKTNNVSNDESVDDHQPQEETTRRLLIPVTDNIKLIVRNIPATVRVPYFVAATDTENYYYSILLQYMPYRNECELLEEHDSAQKAFLAKE